jgi:hypothetical protein
VAPWRAALVRDWRCIKDTIRGLRPARKFCPSARALWLAATLLTGIPGAYAVVAAADQEPSVQGGPLQEVIVYARRREERIEDTPLAISVRSGEQLREETASLAPRFGWTDARYQSLLYTPLAGGPAQDLSGNAFYQTPRLQAVLAASYQVPTPAGDRLLRADYAWQDKIQFNVINDLNNRGIEGTYRWNPAR